MSHRKDDHLVVGLQTDQGNINDQLMLGNTKNRYNTKPEANSNINPIKAPYTIKQRKNKGSNIMLASSIQNHHQSEQKFPALEKTGRQMMGMLTDPTGGLIIQNA